MNKNYDNYIVFLLGADDFAISQYIREQCERFGMDSMYDCCVKLAQKFKEFESSYDSSQVSIHESFENFLEDYFDEIVDFIDYNKDFEILKGDK